MSPRLTPTIHAHGEATRLDAVIDLVAFTARPRPLSVALDELPRRMAKVFSADVCSIYLLEREDLVMRGNVGFPARALGEVRLGVGQGITGLALEYMRPISLNAAPEHANYQPFPDLGEDKFPIFLAVPIAGPAGPLGALVLQRRAAPAFSQGEVELAAALTAPIAALADRAQLVDALRSRGGVPSSGMRRITLSGRSAGPGISLGVIHALPRPMPKPVETGDMKDLNRRLDGAIAQAQRALNTVEQRAARAEEGALGALQALRTILADGRLRERAFELGTRGKGASVALLDLGVEAMRTAQSLGHQFGVDRATMIADVCEALSALIDPKWKPDTPPGSVLVGTQFTAFDVIVSLQLSPAAVVLDEHAGDSSSRRWLSLIHVPAVVNVEGLFRWSHEGWVALVDGDHGIVRLNPSRLEIAAVRRQKKQRGQPGGQSGSGTGPSE